MVLTWLSSCGGGDDGGNAESAGDAGETCVDGCVPDTGAETDGSGSSDDESGTSTGTQTSDTTDGTSTDTTGTDGTDSGETDAESTDSDGGAECPPQQPQDGACGGKLACEYGDTCCLCDPDMGCDEWTCAPNFGGVFCPEEYPGVGAQCPMEAISCRYCVAEDPALFCTNGQWIAMAWCF